MSGVIPSNLEKTTSPSQTVFLRSTNAAHRHTDTHTHTLYASIRRNAMRCISPKNLALVPRRLFLVQNYSSLLEILSEISSEHKDDPGAKYEGFAKKLESFDIICCIKVGSRCFRIDRGMLTSCSEQTNRCSRR